MSRTYSDDLILKLISKNTGVTDSIGRCIEVQVDTSYHPKNTTFVYPQ